MKWVLNIMASVVVTVAAHADTPADVNKLCLAIIIDRSASSQWQQIPLVACQALAALRESDLPKVIVAESDQPILYPSSNRSDIFAFIGRLHEIPWGGQADVARALSAAFSEIDQCDPSYKRALLVLTDGKLSDDQVRQIRNLAAAYKARGWPLCITADRRANSAVFLAAAQAEIRLVFLDYANVGSWIESIRPVIVKKTTENIAKPPILPPSEEHKPLVKPQDYSANNKAADINQLKMLKTLQHDINELKTDVRKMAKQSHRISNELPPPSAKPDKPRSTPPKAEKSVAAVEGNVPMFASGVRSDSKTLPLPDSNASMAAKSTRADGNAVAAHDRKVESTLTLILSWLSKYIWWLILTLGSGLVAIIIAIAIYIRVNDKRAVKQMQRELNPQVKSVEHSCQLLICYVGEQRKPIGDFNSFREILVGRGIGCTVYIDNEAIEPQHLKVINEDGNLQVMNLADTPVQVNGISVLSKDLCSLSLPADILLAPEISITLVLESVELDAEVTHEQQVN